METQWLRAIPYEVFKTLYDLNPNFMKETFYCFPNLTHRKGNLDVHFRNREKFGNKSLRSLGAYVWNSSPENIK